MNKTRLIDTRNARLHGAILLAAILALAGAMPLSAAEAPLPPPEPALVRVQYDAAPALRATLTAASVDHAECAAYALVQIARAVSRVDDIAADLNGLVMNADPGAARFAADSLHAVAGQLAQRVGAALQDAPGVDCVESCLSCEVKPPARSSSHPARSQLRTAPRTGACVRRN